MKNSLLILVISFQFLFGFVFSNAKIVYKSIDSTITAPVNEFAHYSLDMNNDGINDFSLSHENSNGYLACYIYGAGEPSLSEIQVNSNSTAYICNDEEEVSENPVDSSNHYYGMAALDDMWKSSVNKSVAVRFKINSQFHYGWIRLEVPFDAGSLFIYECAYEDIPGQSIISGNKVTYVIENNENDCFNIKSENDCFFISRKNPNGELISGKIYDKLNINN